jgi:hypothetical protein
LAEYHQSERDFTSIVTPPIEESALDAYHQSEWDRAPSTALPIFANKADADRDIGLMEFFALPNEASKMHTELGTLEAFHNIDPADRKFFSPGYGAQIVTPNKANPLSTIDPADRKFFMPGYGINAGGNDLTAYYQSERDRTPNIEVGAVETALDVYHQSEWGRAPNPILDVEALSKIDPADRKFFNPGYGTQP